VGFLAPPVGIAIGIAAGVVSLITGLFKSKDEKRREAVQKISSSLVEQINKQKESTLQQAESSFKKSAAEVAMNINIYFEELIAGLESISKQLQEAKSKLSDKANYLNRAYAKRILDWSMEQHEPLTDESINRNIAKVKRNFGQGITIQTKSNFKLKKSQEDIKRVLQEDVSIQFIKY
ncbi:MAG TPA: hypothetical protein V6C93_00610, partial [Allocoleopsis sp.]